MTITPERLHRIVTLFADAPSQLRLEALLDYSRSLPSLPARFASQPGLLERVHECQTPFFVAVEVSPDRTVRLYFDVPAESPTVRGYAGILHEGLDGVSSDEILNLSPHFYLQMGLQEVVSSLRLRGMGAIVAHIRRQVEDHLSRLEETATQ